MDIKCVVFRWTNSYLLNIIDIRQLYTFELLTSTTLFGMIACGHDDRVLKLTLNMTPDGLFDFKDEEEMITTQALVQFLSWVYKHLMSCRVN